MNKNNIIEVFSVALDELYHQDIHLIHHQASERAIVANLACILKQSWAFNNYIIDVEYNREWVGYDPKRDQDDGATTADLIIHKTRWDTVTWNLLYLEAKTYYNNNKELEQNDINAITFFMKKFQYEYWMFLFIWENDWRFTLFTLSENWINQSIIQSNQ